MITAIQSKGLVRFVIEMKNFILRWLHFVLRFPQIKRTLKMCHSRSAAGHWLLWFSESAQMFSKGLEILAPQSFKLRKEYIRKYLNAKVSVDWSALEDDLRTFLLAS
jgi:hypothetical protein